MVTAMTMNDYREVQQNRSTTINISETLYKGCKQELNKLVRMSCSLAYITASVLDRCFSKDSVESVDPSL